MKYKITIFFIIGLSLYFLDVGLNSYDDKEIYISDQEIISLVTAWKSQVGRNPNDDEIARIINNLVEEEILYREALNLGLDREDKIIKRRLAQKISFLKQESVLDNPSNEELINYFNNNKDDYFIDATYTFSQHYFSIENNSYERSKDAYVKINEKKENEISADPFYLGKNFVDISLRSIENDFGVNFASSLININKGEWSKPIESPYGHHIVFISSYSEGYHPDLTSVMKQVEKDILQDKRDKAVNDYLNSIKPNYKIYINPDLKI